MQISLLWKINVEDSIFIVKREVYLTIGKLIIFSPTIATFKKKVQQGILWPYQLGVIERIACDHSHSRPVFLLVKKVSRLFHDGEMTEI